MNEIRLSTQEVEGQFQASKWLAHQALLDTAELEALLKALFPAKIFLTSISDKEHVMLSPQAFLAIYDEYVSCLKEGKLPEEAKFRAPFSSILTVSTDEIYAIELNGNRRLIRISRPVIQLQAHRMHYSSDDGKFRPMVFGKESILWGLQFSYPQIFQDNTTKEYFHVLEGDRFINTSLFRNLQKWMRQNTIPTPFLVNEKVVNIPIRLGKACLPWINKHPQLQARGLQVKGS